MTETFTASNGVEVTRVDGELNMSGSQSSRGDYLYKDHERALREFFLRERDQELGRWRSSTHPNMISYIDALWDGCWVVDEVTGKARCYRRRDVEPAGSDEFAIVAKEYLAAHPVPKPAWHDAKPGEVWAITTENVGDEVAVQVTSDGLFMYNSGRVWHSPELAITAGRRIWPEVVSDA